MKISLRILTACALAACALTGMAQSKAIKLAPRGIKVEPIRAAKAVATRDANGKLTFKRVGAWIPYTKGEVGITAQTLVAYDEYEFADPTATDLTPGDNPTYGGCGTAGSRWFFGAGYLPGIRYNDMKTVAAAAGKQSTRTGIAWSQEFDAALDYQTFVFTSEEFPDDVNGIDPNDPVASGIYDGVVLSYGPLANGGGFYYFSDVDLTGSGLFWQLPNDGAGGNWQLAGDVDATTNTITIVGQAMLWGVNPGNPTPPCSDLQWDDDVTVDLILTPDELYSYAYGLCPDPLGVMQCYFYEAGATTETLAPTAEAITLGTSGSGGNLASWAADDNNARTICKLFVPNSTSPFIRADLTYTTTKTTPTAISFNVKVSTHTPGPQGLTLYVKNQTTNTFVVTSVNNANIVNGTTYNGVPTGTLSDYRNGSGTMNGRIEVKQTGPSTSLFPCASFEFAQMVVTG